MSEELTIDNGPKDGEGTASVRQQGETTSVQQQGEAAKEKRDWVEEAYECFIKNAVDLEPTDPAGAIWEYFKKNATDELKAKVEAEGKTGESCWKFIMAVARRALGGKSGHIDPVVVYAIAMHYFQDVPKDWDEASKTKQKQTNVHASIGKKAAETRLKDPAMKTDKVYAEKVAHDLDDLDKKYPVKKTPKAKKRVEQGFFFDLLETEVVGPEGGQQAYDSKTEAGDESKEAGDAE